MNRHTIYCTTQQAQKAIELGASLQQHPFHASIIDANRNMFQGLVGINEKYYLLPTAEQMVGWLQSKGCYPYTMPLKRGGKVMFAARFEFFEDDGSTDTFCGFGEDNSIILKAIDMALTYLSSKDARGL